MCHHRRVTFRLPTHSSRLAAALAALIGLASSPLGRRAGAAARGIHAARGRAARAGAARPSAVRGLAEGPARRRTGRGHLGRDGRRRVDRPRAACRWWSSATRRRRSSRSRWSSTSIDASPGSSCATPRRRRPGTGRSCARVSATYHVPASVVVSVWALESNLGRFAGVRPTIATLATLAWEGRRGPFFRAQLLDALRIVDRGDIELARLKGSWAGAMGQVQFMPSSYLQYAVDFDGDGRRDIWSSPADVFASIANYLRERGWTDARGWGREVRLPADAAAIDAAAPRRTEGCRAEQETTVPLPIERWRELGVRTARARAAPGHRLRRLRPRRRFPRLPALPELRRAAPVQLRARLRGQRRAAQRPPVAARGVETRRPRRPRSHEATKGTAPTKATASGKAAAPPATKAAPAPKPATSGEPKHTRPTPPPGR